MNAILLTFSKRAFSALLSVVLLGGMFSVAPVFAQDAGTIAITPLVMELKIEAGQSYERQIRVTNVNKKAYRISFEAFDVEIEKESHNVSFLPEESKRNKKRSLASWITPLGETEFVLGAGENRDFAFSFDVPSDASVRDYYSSLNFYFSPVDADPAGKMVRVRQSIGSLLLASFPEDAGALHQSGDEAYEVSDFEVTIGPKLTEVKSSFSNKSLRYLHLKSAVSLLDASGEVFYREEGDPKRVFPGETEVFSQSFPADLLQSRSLVTARYRLWDRMGKEKYYEEDISLGDGAISGEGGMSSMSWGWVMILLLFVLIFVYFPLGRGSKKKE